MARIEIYTTPTCGFCMMAKGLLDTYKVEYEETTVVEPHKRQEMMQRAHGRYTVPQVFIDGQHIGGYDELSGLERRGKLKPLIAA